MATETEARTGEGETADERATVEPNVGPAERLASLAAGGALVAYGLRHGRSATGIAATVAGGALAYRGLSGRSYLRRAVGTDRAADQEPGVPDGATAFERSITVGADPETVHDRLRDPETLGRVVGHVAEIDPVDEGRVRWTVEGPIGRERTWETQIVEEHPGERLRWETLPGASVPHEVTARFRPAPADRGTEVTVALRLTPPGGRLGTAALERFEVAPDAVLGEMLRRFKSLVETGDVTTKEGNVSGRGEGDLV